MVESKTQSIGDKVFEQLLARIQSGDLAPGTTLNEAALAAEFGVSRGPVREAIRRLQGIQLVSRESFLKAKVTTLTPTAITELFQMREALEGYACRLATLRMSDAEIAELEVELERTRDGATPEDEWGFTDFHARFVQASGNERIIAALCGDLYHLLRMYRRWSGSTGDRHPAAYKEHWQILRAMKTRDPDLAESLMRSHIERAMHHLLAEGGPVSAAHESEEAPPAEAEDALPAPARRRAGHLR